MKSSPYWFGKVCKMDTGRLTILRNGDHIYSSEYINTIIYRNSYNTRLYGVTMLTKIITVKSQPTYGKQGSELMS